MESWTWALVLFAITSALVLWRPGNVHEAFPALVGAGIAFYLGLVGLHDAIQVTGIVWNAALTIVATFVMAIVLEGTGFFTWAADRLIERAQGSARRLFHSVLLFSTFLTLFLNNDGSIILGTPVIINVVRRAGLSRAVSFIYLIGACLMASASSTAIGVSNLANLEAMALAGVTLAEHMSFLLIPGAIGVLTCWALLARLIPADQSVRPRSQPSRLPPRAGRHQPPQSHPSDSPYASTLADSFMAIAVCVVILVRGGVFWASLHGIPSYQVTALGALSLLVANLYFRTIPAWTAILRAPWLTMIFAFGMDLVVFGLKNAGITHLIADRLGPIVQDTPVAAALLPGAMSVTISTLLNNHPGLIVTILTLLEIPDLPHALLRLGYAATILGTDLGSLAVPNGTLAALLWFHALRQRGLSYTWGEYVKVGFFPVFAAFVLALATLAALAQISTFLK